VSRTVHPELRHGVENIVILRRKLKFYINLSSETARITA
jgi:hypothetical protein